MDFQVTPKKSNKKSFLFILMAIGCATLAALLVFFASFKLVPRYPVLVVKQNISAGDPLNTSMFEIRKLPKAGLPSEALKPNVDLSKYLAKNNMEKGDVLRVPNTIEIENPDPSILAARLKSLNDDSLVAMDIPITAAGGMLNGMKALDIVSIMAVSKQGETQVTNVIVENAVVIGVRARDDNSEGSLVVAIKDTDRTKVAEAKEKAKVFVALRPVGYTPKEVATTSVSTPNTHSEATTQVN